MIKEFIEYIKNDLNQYICNIKKVDDDYVLFANLNSVLKQPQDAENKVFISIVNLEENTNFQFLKKPLDRQSEGVYEPPVFRLDITCLFTFYSLKRGSYEGIELLEYVIQYFLSHLEFDKHSIFENIRPTFIPLDVEKTHHLWAVNGGKYHPSVVYKFTSLSINDSEIL